MNRATRTGGGWLRFFPFIAWLPQIDRASLRPDLEAGLIGAILILPQSIALATLAGMPPEYGIYTSIIPVVISSLWGSSWHALSGPNTAVCVMIAAAVAPFAGIGTLDYVGYVLALTLMVGIIQFVIGITRLGTLLDFISQTVIEAIVLAVGFVIIVSAGAAFLGLLSNLDEPFFVRIYQLAHDVPRANPYALAVGTITVASGFIARRYFRRYALVIAVLVGAVSGYLINLALGPANTGLELLGRLSLSMLPFSSPSFNLESMYVLKQLITAAFAIAFLGLMQTVVIARSIGAKSGQRIDTNQEIVGQGLGNMVAPFISCFAGSGSFNRSAAHYDAGARTPMAAIWASVILALVIFIASPLVVHLPMAAVAGALVLVGWGLLDFKTARRVTGSRNEAAIFYITFIAALVMGLNSGVFVGLGVSLIIYLRYASKPNLLVERQTARDGRPMEAVTINGNLFFGSQHYVEGLLSALGERDGEPTVLLVKCDHLTYLDIPAISMVAAEAKRRRDNGGDLYIFVTKEAMATLLEQSGYIDQIGADHIIRRDREHPMKAVLMPYQMASPEPLSAAPQRRLALPEETLSPTGNSELMASLVERLRHTQLFGALKREQLERLIDGHQLYFAPAGASLMGDDHGPDDFLFLVEGTLEARRCWSDETGTEQYYTKRITPVGLDALFSFFQQSGSHHYEAHAVDSVRYLFIEADRIEEMLEWNRQLAQLPIEDTELRNRMALVKRVGLFHRLPPEQVVEAFRRMSELEVNRGDTVFRQGDPGDSYYLVFSGEAEVVRQDQFSDATSRIALLGPGDSFGEEALLQEGNRNASVRMTSPGTLFRLDKADFDELVGSALAETLTAAEARELLDQGKAELIDCRFEQEFNEARIPGARLVPLDRLRAALGELDPDRHYIVYCRSGRRSLAGAFLLRQHHFDSHALAGGIRDWPYEIDATPV